MSALQPAPTPAKLSMSVCWYPAAPPLRWTTDLLSKCGQAISSTYRQATTAGWWARSRTNRCAFLAPITTLAMTKSAPTSQGRADANDVCGDREVIDRFRTLDAGHIHGARAAIENGIRRTVSREAACSVCTRAARRGRTRVDLLADRRPPEVRDPAIRQSRLRTGLARSADSRSRERTNVAS